MSTISINRTSAASSTQGQTAGQGCLSKQSKLLTIQSSLEAAQGHFLTNKEIIYIISGEKWESLDRDTHIMVRLELLKILVEKALEYLNGETLSEFNLKQIGQTNSDALRLLGIRDSEIEKIIDILKKKKNITYL